MKKKPPKLSPVAQGIMQGLLEAIEYTKGNPVPGIKVTVVEVDKKNE